MSFKETQSFQMIAAPIKEKFEECNENYFQHSGGIGILKSAVLYGANGSGKSNFIRALQTFHDLIISSGRLAPQQELNCIPFLLNTKTRHEPTEFEMLFSINKLIYRYGFKLTRKAIIEEWLYIKDKRETLVFERNNERVEVPKKYTIIWELSEKKMIRPNALLLSVAGQFNDLISKEILGWFSNLNFISGLNDLLYSDFSISQLRNKQSRDLILPLLKAADFGIEDLVVVEKEGERLAFTIKGSEPQNPSISRNKSIIQDLKTIKFVRDEKGRIVTKVEMPFEIFESEGTKKYFHLLGPILDTLKEGKILLVDELDTKLHPLLTERIVKLFNNKKTNPKNAQLIFATHDIHLLNARIFRRDQIWFTEKKQNGATLLFSLLDFKKGTTPRNDEKIGKNYAYGKYGAIPFLGYFDELLENHTN